MVVALRQQKDDDDQTKNPKAGVMCSKTHLFLDDAVESSSDERMICADDGRNTKDALRGYGGDASDEDILCAHIIPIQIRCGSAVRMRRLC